MGRGQLHEWTVVVVGEGYIESRHNYFDANGSLVEAQIVVRWNDGTTSAMVTTMHDGSTSTEGQVRYPDDTRLAVRYFPSGRSEFVHMHPNSEQRTTWNYEPNGSGWVEHHANLSGGAAGFAKSTWSIHPDGTPVGDIWDLTVSIDVHTGETKQIDKRWALDGKITTTTKVWDADGNLQSEFTEVVDSTPPQEQPAPTSTTPRKPITTGGSPVDFVIPTTRLPDTSLSGGSGWVGSSGPTVEHVLDWWLVTNDGRTVFLGSTLKTKEE